MVVDVVKAEPDSRAVASIASCEKEYLNGKLYLRRGRRFHKATRFYFEEKVLGPYGDTPWAIPAMLGLAQSYIKTSEWQEAARWARRVLEADPDSREAKKARKILKKASESVVDLEDNLDPIVPGSAPPESAATSPRR